MEWNRGICVSRLSCEEKYSNVKNTKFSRTTVYGFNGFPLFILSSRCCCLRSWKTQPLRPRVLKRKKEKVEDKGQILATCLSVGKKKRRWMHVPEGRLNNEFRVVIPRWTRIVSTNLVKGNIFLHIKSTKTMLFMNIKVTIVCIKSTNTTLACDLDFWLIVIMGH